MASSAAAAVVALKPRVSVVPSIPDRRGLGKSSRFDNCPSELSRGTTTLEVLRLVLRAIASSSVPDSLSSPRSALNVNCLAVFSGFSSDEAAFIDFLVLRLVAAGFSAFAARPIEDERLRRVRGLQGNELNQLPL